MGDISENPENMFIHPENDPLSEVFAYYSLKARVYSTPQVCGAWQLNPSGVHAAGFHLIMEGTCWLHTRSDDGALDMPVLLEAGDLVFLSEDVWHMLSAQIQLEDELNDFGEVGSGETTSMICGAIEFPTAAAAGFLGALPALLHLRATSRPDGLDLATLSSLMCLEVETRQPGHSLILDRLSEVLVLQVLRHALKTRIVRRGVLAAMTEPRLLSAVLAIYSQPGHPWSLESLARHAGLSRSILSQRFLEIVGDSPMHHLAEVRMIRAEQWLMEGRLSTATIAERLGYADEASLGRAFKRIRGVSPGHVRRRLPVEPQSRPH